MPDGSLVAKIGNIVREDPILRFSKAGKPFAKFSLQVKPYVPERRTASRGDLLSRGDRVWLAG